MKRPDDTRNSYVHSASPFLSRITFHWVTDLLSRGYHAPLELHDLGQLPDEETTRNQFERFRDIYEAERVTVLCHVSCAERLHESINVFAHSFLMNDSLS